MYIVTAAVCIIYQAPFREPSSLFGATFRAKYLYVVCLNYALRRRNRYPTRINNARGANSIISVRLARRGVARQTQNGHVRQTRSVDLLFSQQSRRVTAMRVHRLPMDGERSGSTVHIHTLKVHSSFEFS